MEPHWVILIVAAVILLLLLYYYNTFIGKRNLVDQAFSTIDVMLKKRCDLVPNLVATVKEYMRHEAGVLEKITALRARAIDPGLGRDERLQANNELGRGIGALMVQVENYPQLKADTNFLQLQRSLNETEEQLAASRRTFNAAVTDYNTAIQMAPGNLVAGLFAFRPRTLLEADERERRNPDVAALFNSRGS